MRLPTPPRTGIPGLDRFLQDLVAALGRKEETRYLPVVTFEASGSISVTRPGYMFQTPDHPDGYRIGVTTGTEIRWL